jgi:hypothetical protein
MTMGTTDYSSDDIARTLTRLAEALEAQLQPAAALAELLTRPTPMVSVPSDEWETQTVTLADATARNIGNRDLTRLRLTIINSGTLPVYIMRKATTTLVTQPGGLLPAGAAITLETTAEAAVICPTATTAAPGSVTVIIEWRDAGGPAAIPTGN